MYDLSLYWNYLWHFHLSFHASIINCYNLTREPTYNSLKSKKGWKLGLLEDRGSAIRVTVLFIFNFYCKFPIRCVLAIYIHLSTATAQSITRLEKKKGKETRTVTRPRVKTARIFISSIFIFLSYNLNLIRYSSSNKGKKEKGKKRRLTL